MANLKKYVQFVIQWIGDGSNKTVKVKFATDPVSFISPAGSFISPVFSVAASLPAAISNVAVGGATLDTVSYSTLLGELTVTFTANPSSEAIGTISGNAEYS